jgi:sulfate permease, SulP family
MHGRDAPWRGSTGLFGRFGRLAPSDLAGDLFGGLCSSVLAVAYGLSFASLIFAPPLTPWLSSGVTATFITMAVSAAVMAWRSSLPFVVAGPDGATAAVTATLVAALLAKLQDAGAPDDLLAPVMIVMALGTGLTGLLLYGLGSLRAGNAVRYVPFPVIGGFLAATGWLMVSGSFRVTTDRALLPALVGGMDLLAWSKLAAAALMAGAAWLATRQSRSPAAVPTVVVLGVLAGHIAVAASGTGFAQAQALGWFVRPQAAGALMQAWNIDDLRIFPWSRLPELSGDILAMMFVTTVTMLLNTSGVEFLAGREADLQRELKAIGIANLLAAALGGYFSCTSLSRTTLNFMAGGRSRLSGMVVAVLSATVLLSGATIIGHVPKPVLGGLMLMLGVQILSRWVFDAARRISALDYLLLLAVAGIILQWGFLAGIVAGVTIACVVFAVGASQVSAIKFSFDGGEFRSMLDRSPEDTAILSARPHAIQGLILQSYLFFGSANRIYEHVKELFARRPETRFVLFDFRHVTGMDSSAMHSFLQIRRLAEENGAAIVLVHVPPAQQRFFSFAVRGLSLFETLDEALEHCEDRLIYGQAREVVEPPDFADWLGRTFGGPDAARRLMGACERRDVAGGEVVASQGAAADCLYFVASGRVGIFAALEDGRETRVRSVGPLTTIGEMGLVTGGVRSATVRAEAASVLYELGADAFARLQAQEPRLGRALLTFFMSVTADRLRFATRLVSVLQR